MWPEIDKIGWSNMAATRSRKEEIKYKKYLKTLEPNHCVFCNPKHEVLLKTTKYFKIIENKFPYSIWDGQTVEAHLLVVPLKHIDSVAHFTKPMIEEYHKILSEYDQAGYNVYARAPASKIKSITHQHTHLIKSVGRPKRFIVLLRKPMYIRIAR